METRGDRRILKSSAGDLTAKAISCIDGGYVTAVLQQDPEQMGAQALKALNTITSGKNRAENHSGSGYGGDQSERGFLPLAV